MVPEIKAETHKKMDQSLAALKTELAGVRTGRAAAEILHPLLVDYYGTPTPMQQLASFSIPDPQMILVTVFDRAAVKEVEKAIRTSDLGLNPATDGSTIRVPVPVLTEERRRDLVKHVKHLGEEARIAVRNVRRDANEKLKKLEKNKDISQDEEKRGHEAIQQETDQHIKAIDEMVQQKEKELLTV